jgi:hypothetical protein
VSRDPFHELWIRFWREDGSHPVTDCFTEVDPKRSDEFVHFLLGVLFFQVVKLVHCHQTYDLARHPGCSLHNDRTSHRMADENNLLRAELRGDRCDIICERIHRPGFPVETGLAVARKVDGHNSIFFREVRELFPPKAPVTTPSMNKDQCRFALASDRIPYLNSISGDSRSEFDRRLICLSGRLAH